MGSGSKPGRKDDKRHDPLILSQEAFCQALCVERRRTERSLRRIVLMLANLPTPTLRDVESPGGGIISAIAAAVRDSDTCGWYEQGEVAGVIFTEVGQGDVKAVVDKLRARFTALLARSLGVETTGQIQLAFYVYPDEWTDQGQPPGDRKALYPDLEKQTKRHRAPLAVKRGIDIIGSLAAMVILFPVFAAIAVAVRFNSRGPVLFRQTRVGLYGRRFTFLKFRSMYYGNDHAIHKDYVTQFIGGTTPSAGCDKNPSAIFKLTDDPRVTRVGRLLRKTSLDELPQLINVLKGEMSLVGPRPPVVYEYEAYHVWHRRRLIEAKPGITGLWQVEGRSRLPFAEMVRLDLEYARLWSLWLDLKILARTPAAVLLGEGAH